MNIFYILFPQVSSPPTEVQTGNFGDDFSQARATKVKTTQGVTASTSYELLYVFDNDRHAYFIEPASSASYDLSKDSLEALGKKIPLNILLNCS